MSQPRIIATRQDVPKASRLPNPIMNTSKYITYAISTSSGILLPSRHYTKPSRLAPFRAASSDSYIDAARIVARIPRLFPRRNRVEPRLLDLAHDGAATETTAHVGAALAIQDGEGH